MKVPVSLKTPLISLAATVAAFVVSAPALQAAVPAVEGGKDAALVLAAGFIALGLVLRRRVNAGMWASRERAFTRRTQRAARRSTVGGSR